MGLHKPNITIISNRITKCCATKIMFTLMVRAIAESKKRKKCFTASRASINSNVDIHHLSRLDRSVELP